MNTNRFAALATAFALALTACGGGGGGGGGSEPPPPPPPAPPPGPNASVANEVVVQLNLGVSVTALVAAYPSLSVIDQFGRRPIWRLRVAAGTSTDSVLTQLRADTTRVRFAEGNAENETPEGRRRSGWFVGGDAGTFASQWAPASLRLPEAHTASVGAGIRVAVLDTGIDLAHPALAGRLARTGGGALIGRDFVDDDADPSEVGAGTDPGYGHGTHVAGLVSLVAPAATLMPARVLDRAGRGNVWVLAEALAWAADPDGNPATDDGAHVINLSIGTTQPTTLLRTAVALADCDFDDDDDEFADPGFDDDKARCANKFGAVVLAAAGNDGSDTQLQFPAAEAVPGSLSVTAHTPQRTLASFANRGPWVEIAAPGESIISTFPGGGYATWSGTSMASPLAAGTAALVLASLPDPRGVLPLDITARLLARSAPLCGGTTLRKIDAAAAATDTQAPEPPC
jgi:subtilisin family serine protease